MVISLNDIQIKFRKQWSLRAEVFGKEKNSACLFRINSYLLRQTQSMLKIKIERKKKYYSINKFFASTK